MKGYLGIGFSAICILACSATVYGATLPVTETFTGVNNLAGWTTPSGEFVDNSDVDGNPGGWLRAVRQVGNADFKADASASGGVFAGNYLTNYGPQLLEFSYDYFVQNVGENASSIRMEFQTAGNVNRWQYNWEGAGFPQTNSDGWKHYTVPVNPSWSDADAGLAGWINANGGGSWASTLQNVNNIYLVGLNGVTPVARATGLDNVTLAVVPEPASLAVVMIGALGFLRRRRRI